MTKMAAPINMCDKCEIEATVATGFERFAKDEILEKLNVTAESERGKVIFSIPISDTKKVLELCSIDNAYVIINSYENYKFADNADAVMDQFRSLVPDLNWDLGLKVWGEVFSFDHPISPTPTELPKVDEEPAQQDDKPAEKPEDEPENGTQEPAPKRIRKTPWNPLLPAFRCTCYRTGKHVFQSPQAASNFGGEINTYFHWNVDMKKFDIEVILNIENSHVYVSLGLTKESLHRRHITKFGPTTLRPTLAYNMLRFCRIQDNEVVCDPMCGGGSIPIEAAINWPNAVHLCGDIYKEAPPRTRENFDVLNAKRAEKGKKSVSSTVFKWDATRLPLKDESVDVFITDMPFGKRSGSRLSNWHLYPRVLRDLARVCKRDTGRACLLTQDKKCFLKTLGPLEGLWRRGPILGINIGGLAAGVFMLHRTSRKHMDDAELASFRKQRGEQKQEAEKTADGEAKPEQETGKTGDGEQQS